VAEFQMAMAIDKTWAEDAAEMLNIIARFIRINDLHYFPICIGYKHVFFAQHSVAGKKLV
jgi:hypothetical protein